MSARAWIGGSAAMFAVALMGAAEAFLMYRAGPAPAFALTAAAGLAAAVVWRPMNGVYAAILMVPLEVLDLRFGGDAGLSPTEGLLLLTAAATVPRLATGEARPPDAAHLWFMGYLGVAVLGLFYAEDTFTVAKIVVLWTAFLGVSVLVASASQQELQRVLTCIALVGGVVGAVAILGTGEQQLQAGGTIATNRAAGGFAHPNVLAFALLLAIPPALVLALEARGTVVRAITLLCGGLAIAGLLLSLSRGGLIGGAVSLLVLLTWRRFRRYAFGLLTVLALFAMFNLGSIQDTKELSLVGQRVESLTTSEGQQGGRRIEIWSKTPGIVIDDPFLGVGTGNYSNASPEYGIRDVGGLPFDHAHNLFLTVAAETGLIGLFIFGGFLVAVVRAALGPLRSRTAGIYPPALAIVAALTGLLVTSLGEYPLRTNVVMGLILIEIGALVAYSRLAREQVRSGDTL